MSDPNDRDGHKYAWQMGMRAIRRGMMNSVVHDVLEVRQDEWLGSPIYELLLRAEGATDSQWVLATYCEPAKDDKE